MGFNLEEIKSRLNFGGARPTLFEVQVTNKVNALGDVKFMFTCKAASLPSSEVQAVDVFYKGRPIKVAGDRPAFPNWTVTVYNDEDFVVRNGFESWLSGLNEHEGNIMGRGVGPDLKTYKSDAIVRQYSKGSDTAPIKTVSFIGLFPVRLGEIALDWESSNQIETFEVEFAYDYWTAAGTTDGFAIL